MNEITQPASSMGPGEVLRAYDYEPATPEAIIADPAPETDELATAPFTDDTQEAPAEPTLPPDVEDLKKNLLRDYHEKSQVNAQAARQLAARDAELKARESALQSRLAEYEVYDEFSRLAESDPELADIVASRVPRARQVMQQKPANDATTKQVAAVQRQLMELHLEQVENSMQSSHPDWADVKPEVERMLLETNILATVENHKQLRAAYDLVYKAATAGKTGVAARTEAQKQVLGQVKKAAAAARIGGPAPSPPPPAEPSSFRSDGRLRSWEEIASDAAKGARR